MNAISRLACRTVLSLAVPLAAHVAACASFEPTADEFDAGQHCYYNGLGCGPTGASKRVCVKGEFMDDACLAYYCACSGKVIGGCSKLGEQVARGATAAEVASGTCDPTTSGSQTDASPDAADAGMD